MNSGVSCSEINGQDGLDKRVGMINLIMSKAQPHPPHDELYGDSVVKTLSN